MGLMMMFELMVKIREMKSHEKWTRKLLEEHQAHALHQVREYGAVAEVRSSRLSAV